MESIESWNSTIELKLDKLLIYLHLLSHPDIPLSKTQSMTSLALLITPVILIMDIIRLNVVIWETKNGTLLMILLYMKVRINKITKAQVLIFSFMPKNKLFENTSLSKSIYNIQINYDNFFFFIPFNFNSL